MNHIDPAQFGEAIGKAIREHFEQEMRGINERLERIEARVEKCMAYAGEYQPALDYPAGTLVRANGRVLVAIRDIRAGGAGGTRDGSGWEKIMETRDHT